VDMPLKSCNIYPNAATDIAIILLQTQYILHLQYTII